MRFSAKFRRFWVVSFLTSPLQFLPDTINNPKSILWDKRDPTVLDVPGEDRNGKLVIRLN